MKYATVVTTSQEVDTPIPHAYMISPADPEGNPIGFMLGKYARITFESKAGGCNEADILGVLMHRMAAIAQNGEHRHYERAIACLDEALRHVTQGKGTLEVEPSPLHRLLVESVA